MADVAVQPDKGATPAAPTGEAPVVDSTGAVSVGTGAPAKKEEAPLILGKFKTQADLEKAYTELEKKQGTKPAETPAETPAAPTPAQASKVVQDAGLDLTALSREVAENGELSAESLAKLEAKGIKKDVVDSYIEGQKAVAQQITTEVQSVAGGAEEYGKILDWVQAEYTDEQVQAFNEAVNSGNKNLAKLAVRGVVADYQAAMGTDGQPVKGDSANGFSGAKPFESQAEVIAAMRDQRYKDGDVAYVRSVEARIANSKIFG